MGRRGPKPRQILTSQQVQVLQLVAEGLTNPEIAERLGQPKHWVGDRLKVAFRILGARSRAQAVLKAVAEGVLDFPGAPAASRREAPGTQVKEGASR